MSRSSGAPAQAPAGTVAEPAFGPVTRATVAFGVASLIEKVVEPGQPPEIERTGGSSAPTGSAKTAAPARIDFVIFSESSKSFALLPSSSSPVWMNGLKSPVSSK